MASAELEELIYQADLIQDSLYECPVGLKSEHDPNKKASCELRLKD